MSTLISKGIIIKINFDNYFKEKQANLNNMLEQAESTLDELESEASGGGDVDPEEIESKRVRIKNLHESIKIQLTRLERQIDYIKVTLEMRRLKKQLAEIVDEEEERDEVDKLQRRLGDLGKKHENLVTFMKDANQRSLQQQKLQQQQQQQQSTNNGPDTDAGRRIDNNDGNLI